MVYTYVTTKSKIKQNYYTNNKTEVYGECDNSKNRPVIKWRVVKEPVP